MPGVCWLQLSLCSSRLRLRLHSAWKPDGFQTCWVAESSKQHKFHQFRDSQRKTTLKCAVSRSSADLARHTQSCPLSLVGCIRFLERWVVDTT